MNGTYEHFDLERLNAISISEVARRLGENVRRAGVNHVTTCPWHEDRHPSLTLYERSNENRCHCFACGKGGSVIDYVMQHESWTFQEACRWLSHEFNVLTTQFGSYTSQPKPKPVAKPEEPDYTYIPNEMMEELVSVESSLCKCLMLMFHPEAVGQMVEDYRIGSYPLNGLDDYTVFPSIDAEGRVCNLKVQHYDTDRFSPRFAHSDPGSCRWLGSIWVSEGKLPKEAQFRSRCLFGEHLLARYPAQKVALVESPKNALFGALEYPQYLWIAAGKKGQLKREVLQPLKGRDVIVIPDRDAIEEWAAAIHTMNDLANFTVSDFCRRVAPAWEEKFDIADYLAQVHQPMPF